MKLSTESKTPLQKLLTLRKISATKIAQETGLGYHAVQKTIKNQRHSIKIRKSIANYLQLSYDHLWGDDSTNYIRDLIKIEIDKKTATTEMKLTQTYL